MNQQIRELAEQAGYTPLPGFDFANDLQEVFLNKFAELIVRECADVLVENGDKQFNIRTVEPESHTKTTDWLEGYEEAVKHYGSFLLKKNAKLIKKHFGVEQ